jgi:hypothetical protein
MIEYFKIIGERCSGTNYLQNIIIENFGLTSLEYLGGNKHFFLHYDYPLINKPNILFIGIIREPISWINSFYKNQWHIPKINSQNLYSFLNNEWYSVYDNNTEIIEDRNLNHHRFKNIFELRKIKNNFLIYNVKNLVHNYILIRYEDLYYNFENTLYLIQKKFNLIPKHSQFKNIKQYKNENNIFIPKKIDLKFNDIMIIIDKLDKEQEYYLEYLT